MSRVSIAAAADAAPAAIKIVAFMPRRIRYILAARDGNRSRERLVDKSVLSCRFSVVDNRAPTTENCFQALSSVGRASPSHGGGRRFESGSAYQPRFAPLLRNFRLRNPKLSAWRADFEDDAFPIRGPIRRPHPIRRRGEVGQLALLPR